MGDVLFVWTAMSNMFGALMRTTLAQWLVSIVWSLFDRTCFNRLATHFKGNHRVEINNYIFEVILWPRLQNTIFIKQCQALFDIFPTFPCKWLLILLPSQGEIHRIHFRNICSQVSVKETAIMAELK